MIFKKPEFLILGAQKGGTSSLYRYLLQHPEIHKSKRKEIHFFDLKFAKGTDWYHRNFCFSFWKGITGESSPYYLYHPRVPMRVYEYNSNMKLIILLRNPINRAYSHFHHKIENNRESRSFREALTGNLDNCRKAHDLLLNDQIEYSWDHQRYSYIDRGFYVDQLDNWLRFFPRDQFYINTSEFFFKNTNEVCNQIFEFLKVGPKVIKTDKIHNKGKYPPILNEDKYYLREIYSEKNQELKFKYNLDISVWQ